MGTTSNTSCLGNIVFFAGTGRGFCMHAFLVTNIGCSFSTVKYIKQQRIQAELTVLKRTPSQPLVLTHIFKGENYQYK
jgi:hypothetical protein